MSKDAYHDYRAVKSLDPFVVTQDSEGIGAGVDLLGYEGALMVAHLGASLDTLSGSVYVTIKFQESDDDSTYTDIAAGDLIGDGNSIVVDAAAEDEVIKQNAYKGMKRYVRVLIDVTGTHTNGFPISALIVKMFPRHAPIA